jgi:RNA methyltransferase, TrmH family
MLSKSRVKHIQSLKLKKFRELHQQFIAEGSKLVTELMTSAYRVDTIFATNEWIRQHEKELAAGNFTVEEVSEPGLERITALSTPSPVLAVINIPVVEGSLYPLSDGLTLMLDDIRDPGNLGTIVRIADWFGIGNIICSDTCVDLYNPKTVQSTMGSIARVRVFYGNLAATLKQIQPGTKVYGTFLEGDNIYTRQLDQTGIIIIGNESQGISEEVSQFVTDKLFIPGFQKQGSRSTSAESLNASVAAAIVCSEFRRRIF